MRWLLVLFLALPEPLFSQVPQMEKQYVISESQLLQLEASTANLLVLNNKQSATLAMLQMELASSKVSETQALEKSKQLDEFLQISEKKAQSIKNEVQFYQLTTALGIALAVGGIIWGITHK